MLSRRIYPASFSNVNSQLTQKADSVQPNWSTPLLINGWAEVSGYPVRFLKDNLGFVHLKGRISTGPAGSSAFKLPAGYRVDATYQFLCAHGTATSLTRVSIGTDGNVITGTFTTYIDLCSIYFKAEA